MTLADGLAFSKTPSPPRSCRRWARPVWPTWPAPWACARASWKKCHRWRWAPAPSRCAKWSLPTAPSPTRAATSSPSSSPALKTATAGAANLAPPAPEQAMPPAGCTNPAQRHARHHRPGHGSALRGRYGLRADLAGKTGTTQDNTDGWFIALHPRVVAGAWVGFNDGRITLRSDYWGQGAHSACPWWATLQQAFRTNTLDGRDRFVDEETPSLLGDAMNGVRTWVRDLFGRDVPRRPRWVPTRCHHLCRQDAPTRDSRCGPSATRRPRGQGGRCLGQPVPLTPAEAAATPVPGWWCHRRPTGLCGTGNSERLIQPAARRLPCQGRGGLVQRRRLCSLSLQKWPPFKDCRKQGRWLCRLGAEKGSKPVCDRSLLHAGRSKERHGLPLEAPHFDVE